MPLHAYSQSALENRLQEALWCHVLGYYEEGWRMLMGLASTIKETEETDFGEEHEEETSEYPDYATGRRARC